MASWQPEELTPQIDGVTQLFTTSFTRVLGQLTLFFNGSEVDPALFSEPDADTILLTFLPRTPNDRLRVHYLTTQVATGRVVGFPSDPTGGGALPLSLEDRLDALDNRIDANEGGVQALNDQIGRRFDYKNSCEAASVGNIPGTYDPTGGTSGRGRLTAMPNVVDGITLQANFGVLLKDQTNKAERGIWKVITPGTGIDGVWERREDFDQDIEVTQGARTTVVAGVVNASTAWVLSTADPIIIGGTSGTDLDFTTAGLAGLQGLTDNDQAKFVASDTSGDDAASGLLVTATPDGAVRVKVQGLGQEVGDGVKTKDCYFSADGGTTARGLLSIQSGDQLFWNGVIAGFNLLTTYRVSFNYLEA